MVRWLDAADARIKRMPVPMPPRPSTTTATRRPARRKIGARR
jgi:hypothetical protein